MPAVTCPHIGFAPACPFLSILARLPAFAQSGRPFSAIEYAAVHGIDQHAMNSVPRLELDGIHRPGSRQQLNAKAKAARHLLQGHLQGGRWCNARARRCRRPGHTARRGCAQSRRWPARHPQAGRPWRRCCPPGRPEFQHARQTDACARRYPFAQVIFVPGPMENGLLAFSLPCGRDPGSLHAGTESRPP